MATLAPAAAEEYRLGPQDKLTIRVVEWQAVDGTSREWSAVSGEYTVGAGGALSLPFVGEMPAAGRTTAEIAEAIEKTLEEKFALTDRPAASVELLEYRPFYISGDVQAPGQYPYVPELTALKAISIAGGMRREAGLRIERDFIRAKGSMDALADERVRLLVSRARIDAQLADKSEITVPKEVASHERLPGILADEEAIMKAQQKKLSLQLAALDDLKSLLRREIDSLEQKVKTQTRQVNLAKEELEGVGSLAERGLVVNTRVLSAERTIAEMESKLLDHQTAILKARQDLSRADQDIINLQNTYDAELTVQRQQVEAKLAATQAELETQRGLMSEALALAPEVALRNSGTAEPSITIVRNVRGRANEIVADDSSAVWPGDIVKVRWDPLPAAEGVGQ